MFAPIQDVKWLNTAGNELAKAGFNLPPASPNARAHAARLKALNEKPAAPAAEAKPAAGPKQEPAVEKEAEEVAKPEVKAVEEEEDDDDDDSDDDDEEDEVLAEEVAEEDFDASMSEEALKMREDLMATRHELRAFHVVHRSSAGKLRRRLARKSEKLAKVEAKLGNDPDKLDFMRKVNRELADAQRKLLNLQYTWTNMEAEVTELEWQESKGKEEFEAVESLGATLKAELNERRVEQEETDAELAENKDILAELQLQHKRASGTALDGMNREELKAMKTSLTDARAAILKLIESKEGA